MLKLRAPGFAVLVTVLVAVWVAVAAGASPLLVDRGGRVLSTPQVSAIYVGDYWMAGQGASEAFHLDAFLQTWLRGPSVTGVLAQYRVGLGSFTSSDKVAGAARSEFTDADAQALVQQELAAGRVVGGDQAVHVVYLPPGTVLTFEDKSSQQKLGGYHSSYLDAVTGERVYYAVVVYNEGANGLAFTSKAQDNISIVASRVVAGALTNPDAGQGVLGWFDGVHGEVGDVAFALSKDAALGDVWGLQNGFAVVLLWSNKDGKLDAGPVTATIGATATGEQTLSISPASQEAIPGSTVSYTVSNAATSVDSLSLSLSELAETLVGTFGQTVLARGESTTLSVAVAAGAVAGTTTTFTVTGTPTTVNSTALESVTATIAVVTALTPAPAATTAADFSLTVTPTSQEMVRGGEVITFTITTAQVGDGSTTLKLKALHLRRGIKAYLSRTRIAAGETAILTIMAHKDAKRKTYEIVLKGSSDQADQRVPLTVVVR